MLSRYKVTFDKCIQCTFLSWLNGKYFTFDRPPSTNRHALTPKTMAFYDLQINSMSATFVTKALCFTLLRTNMSTQDITSSQTLAIRLAMVSTPRSNMYIYCYMVVLHVWHGTCFPCLSKFCIIIRLLYWRKKIVVRNKHCKRESYECFLIRPHIADNCLYR